MIRRSSPNDRGLVHLKGLSNLSSLSLSSTAVTDAGLSHLTGLTKLSALYLENTGVTDAGLVHLARLQDSPILSVYR